MLFYKSGNAVDHNSTLPERDMDSLLTRKKQKLYNTIDFLYLKPQYHHEVGVSCAQNFSKVCCKPYVFFFCF